VKPGATRTFWAYTGPRGLAGLGQIALQRLDIVLVAVLLDAVSAAVYTAATRFVALSQLGNSAVAQAVQPKLASLLAIGDRSAARTVYQTATAWVVLATWPIHLGVIAVAPYIVKLFGPGYGGAEPVIVLLAGAMLIATGCGMVTVVLVMAGKTWWNLINIGVSLSLTIVIDLVLVPRIGIIGAGVGWAVALVVGNLLPLWQVWRHLGLHPFGPASGLAYVLAATCLGVVPLVGRLVAGDPGALVGLALGLLVYAGGVWRARGQFGLSGITRSRSAR
jgi:O-antigen/teichoic acid export membrane protein